MKATFLNMAWLFIGLTCICGICSKGDEQGNNSNTNGDNYKEPVFNAGDTWLYLTSSDLPRLYPNNYVETNLLRPTDRKWISVHSGTEGLNAVSHQNTASMYVLSSGLYDSTKNSLSFSFENTDKFTRFCSENLNPGGKEVMSIYLYNFNRIPGPETYTITHDIPNDYKIAGGNYDVYKSNGQKYDSTSYLASSFLPNGQYSTFTITSMIFLASDPSKDIYKMSGTAHFLLPYILSKSQDVVTTTPFTFDCVFNNIPISFYK